MMNQDNDQTSSFLDAEEVTTALHHILVTDKFSVSPQMSAFLKYVVEQTLLGNTRRIKAFTVGIEALGKPASFDPQTDPSVRVLAKRLRSSLDTYYVQNPDTTIFIEMKPGSYIPRFLLRSEMSDSTSNAQDTGYQATASTHTLSAPAAAPNHSPAPAVKDELVNDTAAHHPEQHSGISQLWQAYKSASKVA
ncbi:hypothetical protein [Granulosicoccus antarcticus]|uniref:Uncharacterized protein n=1 Tax=Granulosicoccus antarcticus IMCC3135 TaxID=1192854 RepID=A0A2Z2NMT0_9GAMM|nr:hypothetical protein [Granulosicoccus antarcticus]ASJ71815.1 hypothetical protein IMCC3135_08580 [Granulosicoccus antarcticus IMCC3135]